MRRVCRVDREGKGTEDVAVGVEKVTRIFCSNGDNGRCSNCLSGIGRGCAIVLQINF